MFVNSSIQYLNLKEDLWHECLEGSYGFLRTSWPGNWLGMPVVLLECLRFLNLQENNLSEAGRSMLEAAKNVAFEIENMQKTCQCLKSPNITIVCILQMR